MAPTLEVRIGARIDELVSALDTVESRVTKAGSTLSSAGLALTAGLTVPLVGAGTAALTASTSFEAAMTKINTLVGVSQDQVRQWSDQLLQLGPALGKSPKELADALYFITSDGIRGAQAIDILTQSAKAAEMGLGQVDNVASTVTAAINAYGAANITASQAVDQMTAIVTQGKMRSEELAGEFGRILPISAAVGVSFAQAGGFIATFTRVGVNSAEAITALRAVLLAVIKPAKQSEEALAEVGMSAASLKQEIQEKGLTQAFVDLVQKFQDIGKLDDLAKVIPNVRGLAGALAVFASQGQTAIEVTKNIEAAVGNTDAGFKTFQQTSKFTWDQLVTDVESTAVAFGNDLAPSFKASADSAKPLLDTAKDLAHWFGELPSPVQTTTIGLLGLAAAVGPATYLIGNLVKVVGAFAGLGSTVLGWLGAAMPALGALAPAVALVATAWGSWKLGEWIGEVSGLTDWFEKLALRVRGFSAAEADAILESQRLRDLLPSNIPGAPAMFGPGSISPVGLPGAGAGSVGAVRFTDPFSLGTKQLTADAQKAKEEFDKLVSSIEGRLNGSDITKNVNAWMIAVQSVGGVTHLTDDAQEQLNHTLSDALALYEKLGKTAPQAWTDTYTATLKALAASSQLPYMTGTIAGLASPSQGLNSSTLGPGYVGLPYGYSVNGAAIAAATAHGGLFSGFGGLAERDLGPALLRAFEGGGHVGAAFGGLLGGQLGKNIASDQGLGIASLLSNKLGSFGSAIGSVIPGLGTLLGGIGGDLLGKLFSIGGPSKEEVQGRQTEGQFEQQMGGWQGIQKALMDAGLTADQTNAKIQALWASEKQGGAAVQTQIDGINQVLKDHEAQVAADAKAVEDAVTGVTTAAQAYGGQIPAEMQQTIQKLLTMNGLTDDQKTKLQALTATAEPDFQKLQGIADSYGISLQQLGPKFEQAHIDTTANKIFDDFTQLTDAGADVNGVIAGMGKSINAVVGDALKFGVSIPQNMQPVLQKMIDLGLLTDDQGKKLTDLSGINFDDAKSPLQKSLDGLKDSLDKLNDTLQKMPENAKAAADGISANLSNVQVQPIHVPIYYDRIDDGADIPKMAGGGIVTRPTLALIGEAGPEAVVPLSGGGMGSIARAQTQIVQVAVDGRVLAETMVPHQYDALRAIGAAR